MGTKVRAAVVGLKMGAQHAKSYAQLDDFDLCGLCDANPETLREVAQQVGNPPQYTSFADMLAEQKPEVAAIATPNHLHESMTIQAVEAGVKAVYCEKPITLNMAAAIRMRDVCRDAGVALIIGHQRRMSAPYRTMRQLIEAGAIGEIEVVRGSCAGDMLSDGTHLVDSLMYLFDDTDVRWVLGQVYRGRKATAAELAVNRFQYCGTRYGHNVEEGAMAVFQFANGIRAEIMTGTLWRSARGYQDIEVFGKKGRLLRAGDSARPALLIDDGSGWRDAGVVPGDSGLLDAHRQTAVVVREGGSHPMEMARAIKGFEVIMAIYESARIHARLDLPLNQMAFPLDLMLQAGLVD